jgi:DNA-binding response OmpR family regulator
MTSRSKKGNGRLAGTTILVLEDEMLIALELSMVLKSLGASVLGPVGRLAEASKLVLAEKPNAAVLDVKLDRELSLTLARELVESGVAVVLLTGYDRNHVPEGYDDIPLLMKPVSADNLADILRSALDRRSAGFGPSS